MSIDVILTNVYAEKALEPRREEMKCRFLRVRRAWDVVAGVRTLLERAGSTNVLPITARSMTTVANMAVFNTCQRTGNVTRTVSGVRNVVSSEGSTSDSLFLCHEVKSLSENASK